MIETLEPPRTAVTVVADAGPLIHLDELNSVALLADFAAVLVPGAVWDEVARHRPKVLSSAHLPLKRCAPARSARVEAVSALYTLHAGEIEALCQCTALPGALLLTDDTAARLAARTLGVTAHGTVGVLLRSIRRGQLPKDRALNLLRQIPDLTTLHLRPALLDEIIQQVAELQGPPDGDGS